MTRVLVSWGYPTAMERYMGMRACVCAPGPCCRWLAIKNRDGLDATRLVIQSTADGCCVHFSWGVACCDSDDCAVREDREKQLCLEYWHIFMCFSARTEQQTFPSHLLDVRSHTVLLCFPAHPCPGAETTAALA